MVYQSSCFIGNLYCQFTSRHNDKYPSMSFCINFRIQIVLGHVVKMSLNRRNQKPQSLSGTCFRSNQEILLQWYLRNNCVLNFGQMPIFENALHGLQKSFVNFPLIFKPVNGFVAFGFFDLTFNFVGLDGLIMAEACIISVFPRVTAPSLTPFHGASAICLTVLASIKLSTAILFAAPASVVGTFEGYMLCELSRTAESIVT